MAAQNLHAQLNELTRLLPTFDRAKGPAAEPLSNQKLSPNCLHGLQVSSGRGLNLLIHDYMAIYFLYPQRKFRPSLPTQNFSEPSTDMFMTIFGCADLRISLSRAKFDAAHSELHMCRTRLGVQKSIWPPHSELHMCRTHPGVQKSI